MIWLQGAGCSGCSVSVLNVVSPNIRNVLVDEVIPGKHVNLRFHPTVMAGAGEPVIKAVLQEARGRADGFDASLEEGQAFRGAIRQ